LGNELDNKLGNESGNNQVTNHELGNELDNKLGNESGNNQVTNHELGNELDNKLGNELGDRKTKKIRQNKSPKKIKSYDELKAEFLILSGKQLELFNYILSKIESPNKPSNPIISKDILPILDCSKNALKVHIDRLVKKQLIYRSGGKTSRSGYMIFSINKNIYSLAIKSNIAVSKNTIEPLYNNSNNNYYKNNEEQQVKFGTENLVNDNSEIELKGDWEKIDFSELEEFGFKKSHLQQIKKIDGVTPETVQDSINHYAWALHNRADEIIRYAPKNNRFKGLFGVLRKGSVWVEDGYIDPIDEAINKSLEAKKKQLEKIKKQKEDQLNLDFEIWKESLSEEDWQAVKGKIKKETSGRDSGGMFDAALKKHFKTNIKTSK
jgi:DNA-binding MarR family transcriptional regulator